MEFNIKNYGGDLDLLQDIKEKIIDKLEITSKLTKNDYLIYLYNTTLNALLCVDTTEQVDFENNWSFELYWQLKELLFKELKIKIIGE